MSENNAPSIGQIIHKQNISSFVSNIVPLDKALLLQTVQRFRPDSKNYEDSWGYVIQATRHRGFKWYDKQTGELIFFGRKSDTDPTLVVPTFFADPEYLRVVVKRVQNELHVQRTILKNINPEDIKNFIPYGFRPYQKRERWSPEAPFDDQTYPQQVADLKKLAEAKGKAYHQLRKALNKKPNIAIRKYCEAEKANVLDIFALKDVNIKNTKERARGIYFASHAMYPTAEIDKFIVTDCKTGEIVGFTATSDISLENIALVASIFKPGVKIASVWGIYQTLLAKYNEGFRLVNLGGSETEGTAIFLSRTFRPVEQLEKTHLVYQQR